MIGIITQNNTILTALTFFLKDCGAEKYLQQDKSGIDFHDYEAVLLADPLPDPLPTLPNATPIITLGAITHKRESLHLDTPIMPDKLCQKIQLFLEQSKLLPTFENSTFLFEGRNRLLIDKQTGERISLTEKENALLCCLVTAENHTVSRDQLLVSAWNYSPDTETHTVESHIYTLRQKIGSKADSLFLNTTVGYVLVSN